MDDNNIALMRGETHKIKRIHNSVTYIFDIMNLQISPLRINIGMLVNKYIKWVRYVLDKIETIFYINTK